MTNLRDKFKPTKVADLKKNVTVEDADFGNGMYLKITPGKNRFRLMPSHKPGANFYTLRAFYWLKNYTDDGSDNDTYKVTVLSAKHHYPGATMDLVDEYARHAKSYIEERDDLEPEEKAARFSSITDWKAGLNMTRAWDAYALKIIGDQRNFGLLEFNKIVRDKLNNEAMLEDGDDPIEVDPFTDVDTGRPFNLSYDKDQRKVENRYVIKLNSQPFPLTDDELELLDKSKPLDTLFQYSQKDWERALEGLKIFDDENEIGLFESDEWLEKVGLIRKQFDFTKKKVQESDEVQEKQQTTAPKSKTVSKQPITAKTTATAPQNKKSVPPPTVVEDEDEEDEDEDEISNDDGLDSMDRDALKAQIALVLAEDQTEETSAFFRIKKSMSDEVLREKIREYRNRIVEDEETPRTIPLNDVLARLNEIRKK